MRLNTFRPFRPFNRLAAPTLTQQVASIFSKYPTAQGAWYDPSDFSTLFQDSAGTVPVTAVGQPVGLQRDKSGRGNNRHQPTTAARPILQKDSGGRYYLSTDGVDDCLYTPGDVDFSGSDEVTVCAGLLKGSDAASGFFVELGPNGVSTSNSFLLAAPNAPAANNVVFYSRGDITSSAAIAPIAAPYTGVLTVLAKIGTDSKTLRSNGVQVATSASDQGIGNYGNYKLNFFRREGGGGVFTGRDYGTLILGKLLSGSELTAVERWAAQKCGVTL